jgi:hypothetical protein
VGSFVVGGNLWVGLPYKGLRAIGAMSSFGLKPGDCFGRRSGLFLACVP